ncbi:MAG: hypothetical protein PWP28_242 [Oceanotoga sp.]|uniref:oligosaccharide flippase family protein n=1 Tax=Oceanotoga sp. TaxID=2108366 RepID=UPI002655D25B|nr:oligosaccharide flippase family protein [Oceanotoga sp.]MDN5341367.1 hypothetical protein [Oceanotoga sp.]
MDFKKLFGNKVVKAGSWYTITNFFTKGIAFLTLPIFTRLLNTEDYGIVSLFTSWVGIFSVIISLDLMGSVGRGKTEFKEKYDEYASSILFLSLIIFSIFLSLSFIFSDYLSKLIGLEKTLFYLMIFGSYFTFVLNFTLSKFRFEYKYKTTSIITILKALIAVGISIYLIIYVFDQNKYYGRIIGQMSPLFIVGIIFLFYILIKGKKLIDFKYWKFALSLSIPLIPHNISHIINSQFDRIVIDRYVGSAETGIYSFAYNLSMIVTVLLASTNTAWVPWFYEKMEKLDYVNIKNKGKMFRDIFTIGFGLLLLLSPEIVKIMADESYWEGLIILPIVFLGIYFQFLYTFEVNVEFFLKKTSLISFGTMLSAGINVGLNFWLVPRFGYIAAAYTTLISYMFLFIFHYIFTTRVIKTKVFGLKFHLFAIISSFSITIFFIVFQEYLSIRIIGVVVLFYLLYRKLKRFSLN